MKFSRSLLPLFSMLLIHSSSYGDGEIDYIERFALAEDRAEALKELIPGTEEFYYFSSLHAQHEGRLDEVDKHLEAWQKRFGESERYQEIRNRQALLRYSTKPRESLAYLENELGLNFNHQKEKLDATPDFPTRLDPGLIAYDAFVKRALAQGNLSGITDQGLDALLRKRTKLTPSQRRELLSRLKVPDHESLVNLIAEDLRSRESQGFGEFEIHHHLTLAQLDELAGLRPELAQEQSFVEMRLQRLHPNADEASLRDPSVEWAHLERVWAYVKTLPPSFGSMKAAVLYRRLELAEQRGEYPEEEFLDYLRLPRLMPYMKAEYLRKQQNSGFFVDLNVDHRPTIGLPPIGSDESLVRRYLEHDFLTADSTARYAPYLDAAWLKRVFAETKLLHGLGDAQEWLSQLGPAQVQNLKERVEIAFAPTNSEYFSAADTVSLSVSLKNVPELIVKVYEINTLNFYRDRGKEINTDLDLDGLIANQETVYRYKKAPIQRHSETFAFDSMAGKRGAWVVELIGNGISSRALIRKGELQALSRTTVGGELLMVVDEANQPVIKAAAWFGGKRYEADEKGFILLPFSKAGSSSVILSDGDFASLARIDLPQEEYHFDAKFFIEQETLLPGREASVTIRPLLSLKGEAVSVSNLKNTRLSVTTLDLDGVESISEAENFALYDDRESTYSFRVPPRLRSVKVELKSEVPSAIKTKELTSTVTQSEVFELNGIEAETLTSDLHLSRFGDDYVVQVLGRSGETLPDRAITFSFHHPHFAKVEQTSLKSDEQGRIHLGPLAGIDKVSARARTSPSREWQLHSEQFSRPSAIHARAGEVVEIPLPSRAPASRESLAILELHGEAIVADHFDAAKFESGLVRLEGLKPGNYGIILKEELDVIELKVTASDAEHLGYLLSHNRHLEHSNTRPLYVRSTAVKDGKLLITLGNTEATTRVHLVATRFLPEYDPFAQLATGTSASLYEIVRGATPSRYISGRDIGEEYRYILERRNAKLFPGNLLNRPGLPLNPWELSETETAVKDAAEGQAHPKSMPAPVAERMQGPQDVDRRGGGAGAQRHISPSLNFLAHQALVLTNLEPAKDGTLAIELASLGDRQMIQIVAIDHSDTASISLALAEPKGGAAIRDLRLETSLDAEKHFTQRRKVTLLRKGQSLTVPDFRGSEMQVYDTIGGIFQVLLGISDDDTLSKFSFAAKWPSYDEAKQRELYSEHACHELNFFLSQKDPAFFDAVVKPYLANKKDKTFLDHYLLGDALDRYLAPWEYGRLNIVERILLARRSGDAEQERTASHITSLYQLLPPDPERDAFVYRKALRGRGADLGDHGAFATQSEAVGTIDSDAVDSRRSARKRKNKADSTSDFSHDAFSASDEVESSMPQVSLSRSMAFASMAAARGRSQGPSDEELLQRAKKQTLYETLDSTKELAENNYYHLPIDEQDGDLIEVNRFWRDFANWDGKGGFYSREFPAATSNFTEMMFALSVLDLPFSAEKHEVDITDNVYKLTAASPLVIFHEEFEEAPLAEELTPILVSQNFLRADDRQREEEGQMVDKFITSEFLTDVVYVSQVVITNPTSSVHRLDLLVQIPAGAVPVAGGNYTSSHPLNLSPFSTQRIETHFYFPSPSKGEGYTAYPVQVAKNEQVISSSEAHSLKVVTTPTTLDEASWDHLSQYGSEQAVLDYLATNNLYRLDLSRIAWRARESVDFLRKATSLIGSRHGYDETLWSYGLHHNDLPIAREYLKHREDFLSSCGQAIECELVSLDPVERAWYQHLDYAPLVNARIHPLGRDHRILNDRFHTQYHQFLDVLAHQPRLDAEDRLAVATYLSLQDRIEEALHWLDTIPEAEVVSRVQYDYLRAYHAFHREDLAVAKSITKLYTDYPVERWRASFAAVANQLAEIEGADAQHDENTREGRIEQLSSKDSFLELGAKGRELTLRHRQLKSVTVNYYEMDLEFLFSSRPFVSADSGSFSYLRPNHVESKELPADGTNLSFSIPKAFASKNVLVEVVGDGKSSSVAVYSNHLDLRLSQNYGQLELLHDDSGKPISKAYVKVYARMKDDGVIRFFKDGYTDLRGRFDYASLSTNELDRVEALSLLVMSEEYGSLVREVSPPQR